MKKILIGSLVGGIILFVWHALAWTLMLTHKDTFKYTPGQDTIMAALKNSGVTTGAYYAPGIDNKDGGSMFDAEYRKKMKDHMESAVGKPAVVFHYTESMEAENGSMILMGFLYDFIAVLCACMLLSLAYQSNASFMMRWWMVMLFAIVYMVEGPLMTHNWMMEPWHYTKGYIYDAFIGWGLTGLWLAKYLKRD